MSIEHNRSLDQPFVPGVVAKFRLFARASACLCFLVGVLVLLGWTFNLTVLESIRSDWVAMKPLTSYAFILSGASLWLLCAPNLTQRIRIAANVCASAILLIALASLAQNLLHPGPIELQQPAHVTGSPVVAHFSDISPFTAAPFAVLALALFFLRPQTSHGRNFSQSAALISLVFSMTVLIGYLSNASGMMREAPYSTVGLHTALSLAVLALGILAAGPPGGIMRVVIADAVGGEVARRLLPVAVIVPLGVFILTYLGFSLKLYDARFGLSFFTTLNIAMLTAVVLRTATSMTQSDLHRKYVEGALQASELRFRALIENSSDSIALFSETGTILYGSPVTIQILGYQPEDLAGRNAFGFIHPDDRDFAIRRFSDSLARPKAQVNVKSRIRHKDGSWKHMEGVFTNLLADPNVRAVVSNYRDVSERKRLEQELVEAQKLESIGRLAGGVAHDFNNILTAIMGYSDLAARRLSPTAPEQEDLRQVQEASVRAATLTGQLLSFARRQIIEPKVIDLNNLILNLNKMLRRLIGENIELVMLPATDLGAVKVDPGQFEQILINLAVNARDAMPDGGRLTVETSNATFDEEYAAQHGDVAPGDYVMLAVSDSGVGIEEGIRLHVFEPFFTTKEKGRGTGLGLATCYGIVKQAGGHIWLYSEPGVGTTFKIYLPRSAAKAQSVRPSLIDDRPLRGNESILIVEDEPQVRNLAADSLRQYGYNVRSASNGEEALREIKDSGKSVDLLITDVIMPLMNGNELADRLKTMYPNIKVVFASGYTENTIVHHGVLDPGISFLPKPFTPTALATKVREVLDGATP